MDTLEADIKEQAIQSVREELALEALFRERGMEVTDEDIDAELKEIASSTETSPEEARKRWEELGLMSVVREQIMHRKAVLWLLDNITVVEEAARRGRREAREEAGQEAASRRRRSRAEKPAERPTSPSRAREDRGVADAS